MSAARDAQARAILADNDRGGYTVPPAGLYPYQWNWDSVFAGFVFAEHDMARALAEQLWSPEIASYDSHDMRARRFAGCISNASFLCWYAGVGGDRMLPHLDRIARLVRYGVPSHDPASPRYEPGRDWRGPVWTMMNLLICIRLFEAGHTGPANRIRDQTAEMIALSGFAEYFDPRDGSPAGGRLFTWTAAIWLGWATPTTGRNRWAASN